MKRVRKHSLKTILLLIVIPLTIKSQNVDIKTTSLQIVDEKLEICYDIINSKKTQRFHVKAEITNSKGSTVDARTFIGDIGKNQKGGKNKLITWDYNADRIVLDEMVNVHLMAEISTHKDAVKPGIAFSKSVVLPGWGLSSIDKTEKAKPYWLLGAAAYGTLTTSVLLTVSSNNFYNKYESTSDPDLTRKYYNRYESRASAASIFSYTAAGIWLTTGIWTVTKANKINTILLTQKNSQKVLFCSQYDPVTKTPGFKLQYNF